MVESIKGEKRSTQKSEVRLPSNLLLPSRSLQAVFLTLFLLMYSVVTADGASLGGDVTPDGQPAHVVLPSDQRMRNTGGMGERGPGSGSGLCVFTSVEHAAKVQNVPQLLGLQKWMTFKPGGGHPDKLTAMIAQFCKERGVEVPPYIQVEGLDLDVIRKACQSGRLPGITYAWSATGRYKNRAGQDEWIQHMVNCCHADKDMFGILDNNHIDKIEWLNEAEFKKTYYGRPFSGQPAKGWTVILMAPGFPPVLRTP